MFCPHCHNKIPDGSNICPLCYSNLAGVKPQAAYEEPRPASDAERERAPRAQSTQSAPAQPRAKQPTYTKGSRGGKRGGDKTPMIIAFGLIVILVIIIVMIVRSMFSAGTTPAANTPTQAPTAGAEATPAQNFIVFGATATPNVPDAAETPNIEITPSPTPEPEQETTSYVTLRKGDQGTDVVSMQQALAELGYLNGAQDGNFGTGTQTAVKNFQKDHGLDVDGIAGKLTLEALYAEASVTPIPKTTPTVNAGDIMDLPG